MDKLMLAVRKVERKPGLVVDEHPVPTPGEEEGLVEVQAADADVKATKTKAIADDAQRDLDEALPALDAAGLWGAIKARTDALYGERSGLDPSPSGSRHTRPASPLRAPPEARGRDACSPARALEEARARRAAEEAGS